MRQGRGVNVGTGIGSWLRNSDKGLVEFCCLILYSPISLFSVCSRSLSLTSMSASTKPSVLILGGVNTCSRALVSYLVPDGGEPKVSVCVFSFFLQYPSPALLPAIAPSSTFVSLTSSSSTRQQRPFNFLSFFPHIHSSSYFFFSFKKHSYLGSEFAKFVQRPPGDEHPVVQYTQVNLTVPGTSPFSGNFLISHQFINPFSSFV